MAEPEADSWLDTVRHVEYVSRSGSTGDVAFGWETGSHAGLVVKVFWEDVEEAIDQLLGSNTFDRASGRIRRQIPKYHPKWPWLLCSSISGIKGVGFKGYNSSNGVRTSTYKYAYISAKFLSPDWSRTLSDDELAAAYDVTQPGHAEYERFVRINPSGSSETLSRRAGDFVWAETSASGPVIGEPLTVPTPQYLYRQQKVLVWHRVPGASALLSSSTGEPTNLDAAVGKVNSVAWLSCQPGELLCKGYRITPTPNPNPDAIEFLASRQTPLTFQVEINLARWSPPPGGTVRGWALFPFSDNKWYAILDAKTQTRQIVESIDLRTMFNLPG